MLAGRSSASVRRSYSWRTAENRRPAPYASAHRARPDSAYPQNLELQLVHWLIRDKTAPKEGHHARLWLLIDPDMLSVFDGCSWFAGRQAR